MSWRCCSAAGGVPGVAQLAEEALPGALVLADAGDLSLAAGHAAGGGDLVGLGLGLARAVAGMHRRGVMHRDICPGQQLGSSLGVALIGAIVLTGLITMFLAAAAGSRLSTRFTVRGIVRVGLSPPCSRC